MGKYVDYVGAVHSDVTLNQYEYSDDSGYYYSWGLPSLGHYDYREDGFTVYNNIYGAANTTAHKSYSYVHETGTWKTNKSEIAPIVESFHSKRND